MLNSLKSRWENYKKSPDEIAFQKSLQINQQELKKLKNQQTNNLESSDELMLETYGTERAIGILRMINRTWIERFNEGFLGNQPFSDNLLNFIRNEIEDKPDIVKIKH